ncbi:hypothetical protein GCM10023328_13890 [Modestobacter marinus]|uniref:Methyltransferase type 11 domain-containing protein n=1 Tax=Modestobacter marinus TaxID=477641 RepID=A0ABQ2G6R7_9ACTN|nr:hypothetical protein GCM10011589_38230 [Modestobacter marinus]
MGRERESSGRPAEARTSYDHQVLDRLGAHVQAFIRRLVVVFLATADARGEADCSSRAGPPGFVAVLDLPSRRAARHAGGVPPAPAAVHHPVFARVFGRLAAAGERSGLAELRGRVLADTAGRVLEVGAGSGSNFAHYPPAVTQVVAVEPEPYLRGLAEQAARRAPVPVDVVDGVAEALPAGEGEFDTVVSTLVLCSVADQPRALRELHRVLRPGGRLVFWEHVRAERPPLTIVQDALDRTVWPVLCGGCHVGRDTATAITAAGFTMERLERHRLPDTRIPLPMAPHVLGTARRAEPAR